MSWIHIDDAVNLIIAGLQQVNMSGVYNSTAPNPVRMHEMCASLGSVLNRPSWLPVPEFALKVRCVSRCCLATAAPLHCVVQSSALLVLEYLQVVGETLARTVAYACRSCALTH